MRRFIKFLTSKSFLISILLLLQLVGFFVLVNFLASYFIYVQIGLRIISLLISLYILGSDLHPMYKLSWVVPILVFPIFGGIFYLFYYIRNIPKKVRNLHLTTITNRKLTLTDYSSYEDQSTKFLHNFNWYPYEFTQTTFLPSGQDKLKLLLEDLQKAEKYIFLEFFIISKSEMFEQIYAVLVDKIHQGVEINIIYDDFGSAFKLPKKQMKELKKLGANIVSFNKMQIHINFANNYRDHRKIVVIDGKIGYTGGINIGDEYINKKQIHGLWQDASIRIEGKAVWALLQSTFATLFFENNQPIDYDKYYIDYQVETDGIIAPFDDIPAENGRITKNLLLSLIFEAKERIWMTTPYLILDNEMANALKIAKKRGIDVKIIIPSIPDKKLVYMVTQAYALELIKAGIEVYYYKPGFIHSKLSLFDHDKAVIGTSNLDFRSLYLHLENNLYLKNNTAIKDMNDYFVSTLEDSYLKESRDFEKRGFIYRLLQAILKGFSSML